ncbi:MAG: hypothetical protein J5968_00700, partial [Oscillospiraceae bacterium]|nr:hypothetical protein [Oscillospiraceae bacterium]MBP1556354.1 hypothetical protein [Oscillospiraceae bacterium]
DGFDYQEAEKGAASRYNHGDGGDIRDIIKGDVWGAQNINKAFNPEKSESKSLGSSDKDREKQQYHDDAAGFAPMAGKRQPRIMFYGLAKPHKAKSHLLKNQFLMPRLFITLGSRPAVKP